MTRPKPKRDKKGHFIKVKGGYLAEIPPERDLETTLRENGTRPVAVDEKGMIAFRGQIPRAEHRPDTPPSGGDEKARPDAPRRCCEDCGMEMQEWRTIIHRNVIFIMACPRCCEDPVSVIRGD